MMRWFAVFFILLPAILHAQATSSGTGSGSGTGIMGIAGGTPPVLYSLTVVVAGGGSVTASPAGDVAIACPTACVANYASGIVVTLTETPGPGQTFSSWSGGGCSGSATTCVVTMTADQVVTASFTGSGSGPLTGTPPSFAFDLAMACNVASTPSCPNPAGVTAIDAGRGVYGYQPFTIVLTNTGSTSLTITAISATTSFSAGTGCIGALAALKKCNLGIVFTPTDIGVATGNVYITYTAGSSFILAIPVSSTGELTITNTSVPAAIPSSYYPTGLFWAFPVVLPSSTQPTTFTITNRGSTTTATGLVVTLNEGNAAEFTSLTNFSLATTCGSSLAPNAFCTATVTYAPPAAGLHRAVLKVVTANAGTMYPEIEGVAVASLLTRVEANNNPYTATVTGGLPTAQVPSYPGGVTVDGPATLPITGINTTDNNINYGGNTITGATKYEVCPLGQNTGGTNCPYATLTAAMQAIKAAPTPCGFWMDVHACNLDGTQAVYNDYIRDVDWPTNYNPILNGSSTTCSAWNYITTDKLSSIPPPGNRISPAWEGYSMLPGYAPFAQPAGGPSCTMPLVVQNAVNVETVRIPQAVGMKTRFLGIHFSGSSTLQEGNTPIITAAYLNTSALDFPDCIATPALAICQPTEAPIFDRISVSGTSNYINMCLTCIHGAGISLAGTSHAVIEDSDIRDIHCDSVHGSVSGPCTTDAKAVALGGSGFVPTSGGKVINSHLSAAAIIAISGGGKTDMTPSDLMFIGNFMEKPLFYINVNTVGQYGQPPYLFSTPNAPEYPPIKGGIELKNYTRALFENNILAHCSYTGQADQFGNCFNLNNINNPNDGQLCGLTPCTGYAAAYTPTDPNFSGVQVTDITVRNLLQIGANKAVLFGNEYNESKSYQIIPPIGDFGRMSIHDWLVDDLNGNKYGPKGGGAWGRLAAYTASPPSVDPSTFGSYCGGPCTWGSWANTIISGRNDRSTHPVGPFNHTFQRITSITSTVNTATPPVSQSNNSLGGVGGSDLTAGAVLLDATATYSSPNCNIVAHFISASPIGFVGGGIIKNLQFFDTPDISAFPGATGRSWVNMPGVTVDTLIPGPPSGFNGHFASTGTNCPTTVLNQANYPLPVFLGFVTAKNGPTVLYKNMKFLDSIFFGDFQGPAAGSPSYDFNWDGSAGNGYCWTGNMMVPNTGPNHISLTVPTNFPNCGAFPHRNTIVGGGTGTYGDAAIGFAHYVDGSWWKGWFGGTNDYTVSGTAATYSTTNGPIGVSPSALSTALDGVVDGVH